MKKVSIKMKITLWYTSLVVFIVAIVMAFIWIFSDKALILQAQNKIEEVAEDSLEGIELENGRLILDDEFEFYDDGVSILIYNEEGELLQGTAPNGFNPGLAIRLHDIQTVSIDDREWMVYDIAFSENSQSVTLRMVMAIDEYAVTMNILLIVMTVSFPILILLGSVAGYWITGRAFRPVQQIIDTVNDIRNEKDLSKRINMQGANDEIHALAHTFDNMFDRLETSFESERQFTADASHELRTPTSVIISQAEYALSRTDDPEEMKESLQVVLRQSKKMANLISQLLLLARTEQKDKQLIFERMDISELAEMVIEEMEDLASNAHVSLMPSIEPGLKAEIDQTLIMRLFMNLISNGIAYNRDGGYVKIKLYQLDDDIVGEFSDNGIGMDKKNLPKIWERFYRIDPARTSSASGNTGLGLALVKWIVEVHEGEIEVSSEYGKGSTFTVRIPKARNEERS
ncbi:MAG: sensor histidine kinase [Bacillus sp. (in: firmicutes)]